MHEFANGEAGMQGPGRGRTARNYELADPMRSRLFVRRKKPPSE